MSPDIWAGLDQAARAAALSRRASFSADGASSLAPPVPAPVATPAPEVMPRRYLAGNATTSGPAVAPPVAAPSLAAGMTPAQDAMLKGSPTGQSAEAPPNAREKLGQALAAGLVTPEGYDKIKNASDDKIDRFVQAAHEYHAAHAAAASEAASPAKVDPSTLIFREPPKAPELAPQAFGGGSRPVMVPGQSVPIVDPSIQAGIASSARDIAGDIDRQKLAEQESAQAKSVTAQTENLANFPLAQEKKEQADLIENQAETRRLKSEAWQDKIGRLVDNLQNSKIDVDKAKHPVTDTIGAILGGFMQGIGHLPSNPIADMIEKRIDRSVEAQRADFENQRAGIRDQNTLYAKAMEETGNADQASQLAKAHAIDLAKDKVQDQIRATLPAQYQADADKVEAVLDERKHGVLGAELKGEAGMNQYVPAHVAGGAGGTDLATEFRKYVTKWNNGDQKTPRMTWEEFKKSYQGYGAEASQKQGPTQKTRDEILAHQNAIANIDALLAMRQRHNGGQLLPGEDTQRADTIAARTQEQLVAALGKVNKGLLDRTSVLIPDHPLATKFAGAIGSDPIGAKLRSARQMLAAELGRTEGAPAAATPEVQPGYEP